MYAMAISIDIKFRWLIIPVIYLSGIHFVALMTKPVQIEDFYESIQSFLVTLSVGWLLPYLVPFFWPTALIMTAGYFLSFAMPVLFAWHRKWAVKPAAVGISCLQNLWLFVSDTHLVMHVFTTCVAALSAYYVLRKQSLISA